MKTTLALAAAGLLAASVPALAQTRPPAPPAHATPSQSPPHAPGQMTGPRPYMSEPGVRPQGPNGPSSDMDYGRWETSWGARPPAPPSHFTRHADWYRHVRACQQRYRSYDPRTDRFVPRRGQTATCRL